MGTHNCGFEGEAQGKRKDVPVVFVTPSFPVNAIVRMKEDNQASFLYRCPNGIESLIVKAAANSSGAHDQTF